MKITNKCTYKVSHVYLLHTLILYASVVSSCSQDLQTNEVLTDHNFEQGFWPAESLQQQDVDAFKPYKERAYPPEWAEVDREQYLKHELVSCDIGCDQGVLIDIEDPKIPNIYLINYENYEMDDHRELRPDCEPLRLTE